MEITRIKEKNSLHTFKDSTRKKFYRTAIISKLSTRTEGRRTRNNVSDFIRQRYEIRRTKKGSLHMKASLI